MWHRAFRLLLCRSGVHHLFIAFIGSGSAGIKCTPPPWPRRSHRQIPVDLLSRSVSVTFPFPARLQFSTNDRPAGRWRCGPPPLVGSKRPRWDGSDEARSELKLNAFRAHRVVQQQLNTRGALMVVRPPRGTVYRIPFVIRTLLAVLHSDAGWKRLCVSDCVAHWPHRQLHWLMVVYKPTFHLAPHVTSRYNTTRSTCRAHRRVEPMHFCCVEHVK